MRGLRFAAVAGLLGLSSAVSAQVPDSARVNRGRPGARGQQLPQGRPALERRVQQALANVVRRQLNLDDARMRQLQQTSAKFEEQRRTLLRDERQARQTLRAAVEDSAGDQARIEQAMTRMLQIQRQRVDLLEAEQRDLATFLTPRQRAQYFALREQVTRRLMEMEQNGRGRRGGPPPF